MLEQTRARLYEQLGHVPSLVDAYIAADPNYIAKTLRWLSDVEDALAAVRSPLTSLVASQRSSILQAEEGVVPAEMAQLSHSTRSRRKHKRIAASLAMSRTEEALRGVIADIDKQFDQAREKLAQLLAVASAAQPIPVPNCDSGPAWLDDVWRQLSASEETQGMFKYLAARLAPSDRRYLLGQILENFFNNFTP